MRVFGWRLGFRSGSSLAMAASGLTSTGALASIIALLPAQVQDVVASLPDEDQEVFSYMVSHSVDGTSSSSGKKKQAQQQRQQQNAAKSGKRNSVAHERAFGCSCFDCYSGYWSLWGASPNKEVIQEAIELNESLAVQAQAEAGTGRRSAWPMGKSRGAKDCPKQKRGKEKTNADKGKSKKKGKGSKASSVVMDSTPTVLEHLGSAAGEASQESEVKEKEGSQADPMKEEQNAPEKKASKKQKDGLEKKEVGIDGGQEKGKAEPVCKPRSKQVAPLDFKEESASKTALQVQDNPIAARAEEAAGKSVSLGSRASEAVGFVCDKLLGMWYPRLRRRS